jgi:hypothetical protein
MAITRLNVDKCSRNLGAGKHVASWHKNMEGRRLSIKNASANDVILYPNEK